MEITPNSAAVPRELASRENDGISVTLVWYEADNRVIVTVDDVKTGEHFEIDAPPDSALQVFHHPFTHAPRPAAAPIVESI